MLLVSRHASLLWIPLVFLLLGLTFGSRQYHWDTLERATLLEHPGAYLRSWDGSPRSQFLSFAHPLELPLAWIVRQAPGLDGMRALVWFEALCAGIALFLLGRMVRDHAASLGSALAAQATLACSWGFWKMGTSGEERILALVGALAFLVAYWGTLRSGTARWRLALALCFAMLCHLSNAVLVPFALLGLLGRPAPWRAHRRVALQGILVGATAATLGYAAVAAWTTHVRTPHQLWDYLTFFHRDTGNDFFHVTVAVPLRDAWHGLLHAFSATTWIAGGTLVALLVAWIRAARTHRMPGEAGSLIALLVLWSVHFVFYEPENVESWTLPVAVLLLAGAWALPRPRQALGLGVIAAVLLLGNLGSFRALHRPLPYEQDLSRVVAASAPQDIILLGGGIQNERPLRGSLATRYFLAFEHQRTIVSLYDVLQITQPEFWGRPIPSVAALQQQIAAGRRVRFPGFMKEEFEAAQRSGLVTLQVRDAGDGVFAVTGVTVPAP